MRLVLHIGMGKTGTSTLQGTLRRNASALAGAGVLYPRGDAYPLKQHQGLMALVTRPERLPREFGAIRDGSAEASQRLAEALWSDIRRQVERTAPDTVVLSYESLLYLPIDDLKRLRRRLEELTSDISVVAYVRHPSTHWLALSQQRVKASSSINPPGKYHNAISNHLATYVDVFDGAVSARAFDREVLEDGCIVADFLHHHIAHGDDLRDGIVVHRENESMSAEAVCILQRLRHHVWLDQDDVFMPESDEVLAVLRSMRDAPHTVAALRPGIQAVLTEHHRGDLDWLAERFDMKFPSVTEPENVEVDDPGLLSSQDLTQLLDVDPGSVERITFLLVKELAARIVAGAPATSAVAHRTRWAAMRGGRRVHLRRERRS